MHHLRVRLHATLCYQVAFDNAIRKWMIYLSFMMATFNDIMLAVGMYRVLYVGTTMFAE